MLCYVNYVMLCYRNLCGLRIGHVEEKGPLTVLRYCPADFSGEDRHYDESFSTYLSDNRNKSAGVTFIRQKCR
jgi:hypothetical protein